jgi:ribonuclease HI
MRAAFFVGDTGVVQEVPDLVTSAGRLRSNNIAEYQALILLLRHLLEREKNDGPRKRFLICGDSELVIRQMLGKYRVKKPHLVALHAEATQLSSRLDVEFSWVPRDRNLAGQLLESSDGKASSSTR